MAAGFVLGSDVGSGGCKSLVVTHGGEVVASSHGEYPTAYPSPGWSEQDPEDWYGAFCSSVKDVLQRSRVTPKQIAAVGIVGVTHNAVLVDPGGMPLHACITFFDNRSTPQAQAIADRWGAEIRERTCNDVEALWSWPQLQWLRENRPELWERAAHVLFAKDYVRNRLAPGIMTDPIDAAGSLLFDPSAGGWIRPFLDDLCLSEDRLPALAAPTDVVAAVCERGAQECGLQAGTKVITGTTDTAAEVLGSAAVRPGDAVVKLASVGRIAVVHEGPVMTGRILNYRHILAALWYPGTASKHAASAYRWLRGVLSPPGRPCSYEDMDREAGTAPAGCGGLLFHPHLMGEWAPYWDERMRASFVGLNVTHGRSHIIRSVMEGAAFGIRDALEQVQGHGMEPTSIRLIGRGASSMVWADTIADVLNRDLLIPAQTDAAYGAALLAAVGAGFLELGAGPVQSVVRFTRTVSPRPERSARLERQFQLYRESDLALRSVNARLGGLGTERCG